MEGATLISLHGVTDVLPTDQEHPFLDAGDALTRAVELFSCPDFASKKGWKKDTEGNKEIRVYTKDVTEGKLFAATVGRCTEQLNCSEAVIRASPEVVFEMNWNGLAETPLWNSNIAYCERQALLTDHCDIAHYASNDVLMVKGRQFVCARMWRRCGDDLILAARSVSISAIPETKAKVRAFLHIAAGRFRADPDDPSRTLYDRLQCMELRGMLPKSVMNQVTGRLIALDIEQIVDHFDRKHNGEQNEIGS